MVDQKARRQYAQLLRQFISGRMTNHEYEKKRDAITENMNDCALHEVFHEVWMLYDDNKAHRMTGKYRLDREGRRAIARAVLFLQTDQEYGWPPSGLFGCLVAFLLVLDVFAAFWVADHSPDFALLSVCVGGAVAVPLVVSLVVHNLLAKRRWNAAGDADAWPFLRRADLEEAARHPRLLNGKS